MKQYLLKLQNSNKFVFYLICLAIVTLVKMPVFIMGMDGDHLFHGDGYFYLLAAQYPIGWDSFINIFPIGGIVFYKLFSEPTVSKYVLFIISSFAWAMPLYLLNVENIKISAKLRLIINICLLLFISSIGITVWDTYVGSESLSLSFLVIIMSTLFITYMCEQISVKIVLLFLFSMIWFILTRDSNYIIAFIILLLFSINKKIAIKIKLLTLVIFVLCVLLMSYSANVTRSKLHFRDIIALYILDNDSAVESNKHYYDWYKENTKMPDIKASYDICNQKMESIYYAKSWDRMPKYPFVNPQEQITLNQVNQIALFISGNTCLSFMGKSFDDYLNSQDLKIDYVRFLLSHPSFMMFASGKYLVSAKFMLLSPAQTLKYSESAPTISKIAYTNKILFYFMLHIQFLCFELLIFYLIIFRSSLILKLTWLFVFYLPMWGFTWLCFIAEPYELHRHMLIALWYSLIGGFYLVLWNRRLK